MGALADLTSSQNSSTLEHKLNISAITHFNIIEKHNNRNVLDK